MTDKKNIFKILDYYFKTQKLQIYKSQIEDVDILINTTDIFKPINEKQLEINVGSIVFNEIFLEYIENSQGQKLPQNIKDAFNVINKFDKQKKSEFGCSNILNAYSVMIDGFKSYIFYLFHTKGIADIIVFFKELSKKEQYNYDKYLFDTILLIDIDKELLYEILSLSKSNDMIWVNDFCFKLGGIKPKFANELYDYVLQKNDKNDIYILSNLLMGLFESDSERIFSKTKDLLETNPSTAYFTFGRLKYKEEKHIKECLYIAEKVDKSHIESLLQIPYIYKSLIENPNTSAEIREKCFSKMQDLFMLGNEELKNAIFMNCQFIKGYEDERYKLLLKPFLSNTQNYYNRINNYFQNFINPYYFFHLFAILYDTNYREKGIMIDVEIFNEALYHFWNINRNETEKHLLNLLSHDIPHLRIGAVYLIQSKYFGLYDINLLNLYPEIKQLRALEALFFNSSYNIDEFLPLILKLRNSSHENVVSYLQKKLSELIINSYHDHLYEKITEHVKDDNFMEPLKESIDLYHRIKEVKTSIDDLNPHQNEHDLMSLYYTLEHEEHQKMIKKIHNADNSFLSLTKQTIIVRGNSWKIGDNKVTPLGEIERSFPLDLSMYRNPDLFDYNHHFFNSEF